MVQWSCPNCGLEFEGASVASVRCPGCGAKLNYGPPFGHWDGFVFVPE